MDRFDNKYNPNLCKILLAISDLLFFNVALWASLGVVYLIFDEVQRFVPQEQLD
ncbi:UDP-phosphate galactose phosphotransferase, partial [Salmonella enterica subsp. enterica serovar Kentucky]